ncbi:putative TOS1-like glycosyl hydrolase-domain-containing protein [Xylariomycetidae sp. FL0641]|nr:putative TOS1-like glycosyl hydrolase-domain-containing protein [Xylariomycetidae sp. FL0641]
MKYTAALLLGCAASGVHAGAFCANSVQDPLGNYFCPGAVKQIKYSGLDIPGKYRAVASMDDSGTCSFKDHDYSGPIAPYDEGLSMHFRGPLTLNNVAVYYPSTNQKQGTPSTVHTKRHNHHHHHLHKKYHEQQEEKRNVVTATFGDKVETWENDYFGPSTAAVEAPATTVAAEETPGEAVKIASDPSSSSSLPSSAPSKADGDSSSTPIAAGDFERAAYYSAESGTADGLVFLGNKGTPGVSGTWDTTWGNSISYVDEDGTGCAASPTVLKNTLLDDSTEIAIFSDQECDESCGVTRAKAVNYKGFEGKTKVFVAKFSMPDSGKTADGTNMPAYWLLNAAIPRTGQYSSCSCWAGDNASPLEGGCGELDVVEILSPGDTRAKSTFHFAAGTGDSHYFARPVDGPMTIAVVLDADSATASLKVLDGDFDFPTTLSSNQIQQMVEEEKDVKFFSLMTFGR